MMSHTLFKLKISILGVLFLGAVYFALHAESLLFPPTVSVLIPVYNRASLLPLTLQSVLDQTERHFELICVDDGSTDQSFRVMQTFARADKRIRVLRHETNKGVGAARDTALKAAYGQYGAILDSDDFARPEWLEESLKFFKTHPDVTVLVPSRSFYYKDDIKAIIKQYDEPLAYLMFNNTARNIGNVFRIPFVRKAHITYDAQLRTAEDYDFWSRILMAGGKFALLKKNVIVYREGFQHDQQWKEDMEKNREQISKRVMTHLKIPEAFQKNKCACYKFILKKPNNPFTPDEINEANLFTRCFKNYYAGSIRVEHPLWGKDTLIFSTQTRVFRKNAYQEEAKLKYIDPNKIVVIWDKKDSPEIFVRNKEGTYLLDTEKKEP